MVFKTGFLVFKHKDHDIPGSLPFPVQRAQGEWGERFGTARYCELLKTEASDTDVQRHIQSLYRDLMKLGRRAAPSIGNPSLKRPNQTTGLTTVEAKQHYRGHCEENVLRPPHPLSKHQNSPCPWFLNTR